MGQIIDKKNLEDNTVICSVLLDADEVVNLKGHLKNIHLFCSEDCDKEAGMNTRGNRGVTKYFKIPLSIRSRKKCSGTLGYQKLDTPSKVFYIYSINTISEEEAELEENTLEQNLEKEKQEQEENKKEIKQEENKK